MAFSEEGAAGMMVPTDDRSAMAIAMSWASRIIGISIEMIVPGLGGYWLDQKFDTGPWLLLVGFALGMTLATVQLVGMVSAANRRQKHPFDSRPTDAGD